MKNNHLLALMKEEERIAIKTVALAQALVEELDKMSGTSSYRQRLKNRGNAFISELDGFLDAVYGNDTDSSICYLVEKGQESLDNTLDSLIESATLEE